MRLAEFLRTWEGHEAENRFSRIIILGLLVVCVVTSLAAWRTERSIILVPPTLTQEVEVTQTAASSEFKESWGLFLAELLGNTTPANADFLKTAIEPLLAPEIYRTVLDAMTDQIKAIKMDRVAISFTPRHVDYEAETNKVFVSGELNSQGPSSQADIKPRTYEFIIAIKNYRPRLEFIDVYPDEPRTLERLKSAPPPGSIPTMKIACFSFMVLLLLSTALSAEDLPANGLPPIPPAASNNQEALPLPEPPNPEMPSSTMPIELPPVDASVLKAANQPATSVAPQYLQVRPGINELMPIALGHLNRLVTPFDNPVVTTTSQATTRIQGKIVYVATAEETPVTLYITPGDNQDIALSLTLIPKRIPAREIHLSLDKDTYQVLAKLQQQATASSGKPLDKEHEYITTLKKLFRDLGLQKTPVGFSLRDPNQTETIHCQQDRVQIRTGQVLEGQDMLILVGVARNTGLLPVEFDERACATTQDEVLAVAAWPKVVLGPKESTELYVVIRRPADETITLRPSLLDRSLP